MRPRPPFLRHCLGSATLALAASCAVVLSYETEDERGRDRCEDGLDNDLDGLTDCFDPGCVGLCLESTAAGQCADGLDNDLDGLADRTDPNCWHPTTLEPEQFNITRCGSVRATTYSNLAEARVDWVAEGRWTADPTGRFEGEVFELGPADDARGVIEAPLTGAGAGTTLELVLSPGGATNIRVHLRTLAPVAEEIDAELTRSEPGWTLTARTARTDPAILELGAVPERQWLVITAELDETTLRIRAKGDDWASDAIAIGVDALGAAPAFSLSLERAGDPPETLLGDLSLRRGDHHPCDATAVPSGAPGPGVALLAFAASAEQYCAIVRRLDDRRMLALRAKRSQLDVPLSGPVDRVPAWEVVTPLAPPSLDAIEDPVMTWDAERQAFRMAALEYETGVEGERTPTGAIHLLESDECASTWRAVGRALANPLVTDGSGGFLLGYAVDDRSPVHRLYLLETDEAPPEAVRVWESPTGEPETFVRTETRVPFRNGVRRHRYPRVLVTGLRGDLLWIDGDDAPGVLTRQGNNSLPLLAPSGTPGTFDAGAIEQGLLWMPPPPAELPWNGLLLYTARACARCEPELGVARFRLLRYVR